MSNPVKAATQKEDGQKSFAEQVNSVVQDMTKNSKGTWDLPEGEHSEEVQYAAMAEKRRRDTQSSYVKTKQSLAQTASERDAFKKQLTSGVSLSLTSDQQLELNDLKVSDPDAWKAKLDQYEVEAHATLQTEMDEVATTAVKDSEITKREAILDAYIEANPSFSLTDDILENDVPPRISNKLSSGEITFEDFLSEVHTYLTSNKILATSENTKEPNLSSLAGGSTPTEAALAKGAAESYAKTDIF